VRHYGKFSGFMLQDSANMDPKAPGIASRSFGSVPGKFERDMVVTHQRTGRQVRLSSSRQAFRPGATRPSTSLPVTSSVSSAMTPWIGDTLTEDRTICYERDPALSARGFHLHFESEIRPIQKIPGRPGETAAGGRRAVLLPPATPRRRNAPGRVGPLQLRCPIPLAGGIQRRVTPDPHPWTLLNGSSPIFAQKYSSLVVASESVFGADKFRPACRAFSPMTGRCAISRKKIPS